MNEKISLLIVTGPVGVGKTSVSTAVSDMLTHKKIPNAFIDIDNLRCAYPSPANDRFNMELGYKNLALIWPNYLEYGIRHLVIPDVIENHEDVNKFKSVIPSAEITIIRLTAPVATLHSRLEQREAGDMQVWHKHRAIELSKQFEELRPEDYLIDTEKKTITEIAEEALSLWLKRR